MARALNRRSALVAAAVLLVAALGVLAATGIIDVAPERHVDGEGPLGSIAGNSSAFYPGPDTSPSWTVAIRLCMVSGLLPAVLDGTVRPASQVQGGLRYLGAFVRQGVPDSGFVPLGTVAAFPPPYPYDGLKAEKGFAVSSSCSTAADTSATYTELDVGLAPVPGKPGGGWLGVDVGYYVGPRHHVVTLHYDYFACEPSAPSRYCPRLATPSP